MERDGPSADYSTSPGEFERIYADQPPRDIGKPQPTFVDTADDIQGSVLGVGCGTGELVLFFAERGNKVVGVNFLESPLTLARQNAAEQGLDAEFIQHDALRLDQLDRQFDNVLDSGLLHTDLTVSDGGPMAWFCVVERVSWTTDA